MFHALTHLFTPHHTNNHRARILHPAGLTVIIAVIILAQSWINLATYIPSLPNGLVLGFASNISAVETITESNQERIKAGLPELKHNPILTNAALAKAQHMFANDYWAHIAPDGTTPWYFIKNAKYSYAVAGENLARDFDTTPAMIQAWMDSPTHRDNILNSKYTEIGIAVVNGKLDGIETTLVVQMFGKPATAAPQTLPSGSTTTTPVETLEENIPSSLPTNTSPAIENQLTVNPEEITPLPELDTTGSVLGNLPTNISLISPLSISKSITLSVMLLLIGVLLYDIFVIHQKKIPRSVGKNWAHLTLFAFAITAIVISKQGIVM